MKLRRSEIFEEYAKIAEQNGLIERDIHKEAQIAREDSKDEYMENIEILYGVKPNGEEKNIVDQAHPEPVIIAPSYDRLNGLVENINERHDIMVGIIMQTPHGKLTQHRYAQKHQSLTNDLLKIGSEMDRLGDEDLRKLADSCSDRLTKEAFWPAAAWLLPRLVGGYLTYALVKTHVLDKTSQGIINNGVNAIKALKEAAKSAEQADKGVLTDAAAKSYSLLKKLVFIKGLESPTTSDGGIFNMFQENTLTDIVHAARQFSGDKAQAVQAYLNERDEVLKALALAGQVLSSKEPQKSMLPEFLADIRRVWRGVHGDVFDDAEKAIRTFAESIKEERIQTHNVAKQTQSFVAQKKQDIAEEAKKQKNNGEEEDLISALWG